MKLALTLPALAAVLLTGACANQTVAPPPPAPVEAPPPAAPEPQTAVVRDPELEQKLARSELQLLEKDAQIGELQARLDEARQEVVRVMARQQSLASRAEAASAIAEAEIALQSLNAKKDAAGAAEAGRLVRLSTTEFDRRNYAGALYLASQAKGAAFAARGAPASAGRAALRAGERPFASPLRLKTTARANVRDGPGGGFAVRFTLPLAAPVTGLSHADQWLRIKDGSGREGWIYQSLVSQRP